MVILTTVPEPLYEVGQELLLNLIQGHGNPDIREKVTVIGRSIWFQGTLGYSRSGPSRQDVNWPWTYTLAFARKVEGFGPYIYDRKEEDLTSAIYKEAP